MSGYDDDILAWSERQSVLLRRVAAGERVNDADLDWPNIAEEIEQVGRSERSALSSHIALIIEHLMKLDTSPAAEPRAGWQETILRARGAVERLTEESPSLRPLATRMIRKELPRARRIAAAALNAHGGQPRVAFSALTYSEEQVLGDWLPAANGDAGSSPQPA
jgi:hypothetical protein